MQSLPKDTRTPGELWADSYWYEKLGMIVFLGIHALPFLLGILQFFRVIPTH